MIDLIKIQQEFKGSIPPEIKEAIGLCFELLEIIPSTENVSTDNTWQIFLLNTQAKAQKSFWSILTLSRQGFGEDALILVRSMLEQAITARYITLNIDQRLWDYIDYEVAIKEKFIENLEGMKKRPVWSRNLDVDAMKQYIKESKEWISSEDRNPERFRTFNKNTEIRNSWSSKSMGTMAKKTKLDEDYGTVYWLACNLSHSNASGLNHFVEETDTAVNFKPEPSLNLLPLVIAASFKIYMMMLDFCLTEVKDNAALENLQTIHDKSLPILSKLPTK